MLARLLLLAALVASSNGVRVTGWVTGRRILGKSVAFLTLDDAEDPGGLQVVLSTNEGFEQPSAPREMARLCPPGAKVTVDGFMKQHDRGWPILVCRSLEISRCTPLESGVKRLLTAAASGMVPTAEARSALLLSDPTAELPAATDAASIATLASNLHAAAPPVALKATFNKSPPKPSAAREAGMAELAEEGGMTRAVAAVDVAGGPAAAKAALLSSTAAAAAATTTNLVITEIDGDPVVVVEGEVRGRRRLSDGFTSIDLVSCASGDDDGEAGVARVRCILHDGFSAEAARNHGQLASPGARMKFAGVWAPEPQQPPHQQSEERALLVAGARLVRSSHHVRAIRSLLELWEDGSIDKEEAVAALQLDSGDKEEVEEMVEGQEGLLSSTRRDTLKAESKSERTWRISELQRALLAQETTQQQQSQQGVILGRSSAAAGARYDAVLDSLADVRRRYPLTSRPAVEEEEEEEEEVVVAEEEDKGAPPSGHPLTRQQQQQSWPSDDRLAAAKSTRPRRRVAATSTQAAAAAAAVAVRPDGMLSTGRDGSFWRTKKRPQLLMMRSVVGDLLESHPEYGSRPINMLDIGGAKGLLAQHLAEAFGSRVNVTVVDIDERRVRSGAERATRRGRLENLHFVAGDASDLARRGALGRTDLVIGLHACGGLSDLIIAHAVANKAGFAVCTCCFLSNRDMQLPAETAMAATTATTIARDDWLLMGNDGDGVSPCSEEALHTTMKCAELQHDPKRSTLGAHTLNALRAVAAERHWKARWAPTARDDNHDGDGAGQVQDELRVELLSFEPKYSPRNFIVVGQPPRTRSPRAGTPQMGLSDVTGSFYRRQLLSSAGAAAACLPISAHASQSSPDSRKLPARRPPENGPLRFHEDVEERLVRRVLARATANDPSSVLATVDAFCSDEHWMMNVGPEKGRFVDEVIASVQPQVMLELGTYVGYSAVRWASLLPEGGRLWSIDPEPAAQESAGLLLKKAGLSERVRLVNGRAQDVIPTLQRRLDGRPIDVVFIDHVKERYLPDLRLIEQAGLLREGSVVCADNVVFFELREYLEHVRTSGLYRSSQTRDARLEYTERERKAFADGVEVSVYAGGGGAPRAK